MTRVAPPSGEEVQIDKRRAMTPARRARVVARDGEVCRYPECAIAKGLEVDHIVCLELGGKDSDENLQLLCYAHHKQKTALDVKMIAKARRLRKDRIEAPTRPKSQIKSRGFDKTRSRRMNGKVVPRKER